MRLAVKVVPKASRDGVAGWLGDALKVCVTAPPERGKANAAVERVVAHALGVRIRELPITPDKLLIAFRNGAGAAPA